LILTRQIEEKLTIMTSITKEGVAWQEPLSASAGTIEDLLSDENIDTSYEPFSREPEYMDANRAFIKTLPMDKSTRVVDLACGTSTMTGLVLEHIYGDGPCNPASVGAEPTRFLGLDLSRESLLLGQQFLAGLGYLVTSNPNAQVATPAAHTVDLMEGSADRLPMVDNCADFVIMGNAIQLVLDQDALFAEISRILRPGGRFAFNTSFYAGTYTPGTEHVYIRWMQEAIAYVTKRDAELRAMGHPGVKRKRGNGHRAFSRPWLSADDYIKQAAKYGLEVEVTNERTVMLDQRCFETIGAYAGLAKVLLSGYPVKLACEALEKAAGPTLESVNMKEVPRYWLEVVLRKTSD
jgi:ubiquinone/menaquinone biosynthesis C-methylase UbiE